MTLKIHHLNCGTMCPVCSRLFNGRDGLLERGTFVCHVFLVETNDGLLLVDTGIGNDDIRQTNGLGLGFNLMSKPAYDPLETAHSQVQKLGFDVSEVRHIALTHLDLDHAGGIADFPEAIVHVHQREHDAAMARRTTNARNRYLSRHWAHQVNWERYDDGGQGWLAFDGVQQLKGVGGGDVLFVPLFGHSAGHCGVAIKRKHDWLMHCGDAYFSRWQVDPQGPHTPLGVALFQELVNYDRPTRVASLNRLQAAAIHHCDDLTLVSAHDLEEFELFGGVVEPSNMGGGLRSQAPSLRG